MLDAVNRLYQGMMTAEVQMAAASGQIVANTLPSVPPDDPAEPMTPGLTYLGSSATTFSDGLLSAMVNLKQGQLAYEANAKAFVMQEETLGTLIDMLDTDAA